MGISKSSSKSGNKAYDAISGSLSGALPYVTQGGAGVSALLGGDTSGLDKYKAATGFNQTLSRGLQGITGAGAARGLLRSGSTGKAFMSYGQELQNQSAQDYIKNLLGLGQLGLGAAGVMSDAGKYSSSKSKSLQFPSPSSGMGG